VIEDRSTLLFTFEMVLKGKTYDFSLKGEIITNEEITE
jgi:hypothetical protein